MPEKFAIQAEVELAFKESGGGLQAVVRNFEQLIKRIEARAAKAGVSPAAGLEEARASAMALSETRPVAGVSSTKRVTAEEQVYQAVMQVLGPAIRRAVPRPSAGIGIGAVRDPAREESNRKREESRQATLREKKAAADAANIAAVQEDTRAVKESTTRKKRPTPQQVEPAEAAQARTQALSEAQQRLVALYKAQIAAAERVDLEPAEALGIKDEAGLTSAVRAQEKLVSETERSAARLAAQGRAVAEGTRATEQNTAAKNQESRLVRQFARSAERRAQVAAPADPLAGYAAYPSRGIATGPQAGYPAAAYAASVFAESRAARESARAKSDATVAVVANTQAVVADTQETRRVTRRKKEKDPLLGPPIPPSLGAETREARAGRIRVDQQARQAEADAKRAEERAAANRAAVLRSQRQAEQEAARAAAVPPPAEPGVIERRIAQQQAASVRNILALRPTRPLGGEPFAAGQFGGRPAALVAAAIKEDTEARRAAARANRSNAAATETDTQATREATRAETQSTAATKSETQATTRKTSAVTTTTQERRNQDARGAQLLTPTFTPEPPEAGAALTQAKGAAAAALEQEAAVTAEVVRAERRLLDAKNRAVLALGGEATASTQAAKATQQATQQATRTGQPGRPGRPVPRSRVTGGGDDFDVEAAFKDVVKRLVRRTQLLEQQLRNLGEAGNEYRIALLRARQVQRQTTQILEEQRGTARDIAVERATDTARRRRRINVRRADVEDPTTINERAEERDLAAYQNLQILESQNAHGRAAIIAARQIVAKSKGRSYTLDQILNLEGEERRTVIQTLASERQKKQLLDRQVQAQRIQLDLEVAAAQGRRPSSAQRMSAWIRGHQTGAPVNPLAMPTGSQALLGRFITTAQFALSGVALRQVAQGIASVIREAEELERIFSLIGNQFEAIGQGDQLAGFRREILEIARTSGVAASEVALVGFQMKGAFGDTRTAIEATNDAIKVSVVTGLEQKELTDSLTAASKAYGVSIEDIGDAAIGLEERFGVLAKESLKVFGDLAIIASNAGLELKELAAIVGVVQQASGRGGAAIAEGFSRILPAIGGASIEIARLYKTTAALQGARGVGVNPQQSRSDYIIEQLRGGQTGDVLVQLIRDYDKLDASTQRYLLTLLGGRRETQYLVPLFENTDKALRELDRTESDAGKTSERFADIQNTLAQQLLKLREELRQVGDALARSGLLDFAKLAAAGLLVLVRIVRLLAQGFASFSDALDGFPGKFAAIVAGIAAVRLSVLALQKVRAGQTVVNEILYHMRGLPPPVPGAPGGGGGGVFAGGVRGMAGRAGGALGKFGAAGVAGSATALGGLTGAGAFAVTAGVLALDAYLLDQIWEAREKGQRSLDKQLTGIEKTLAGKTLGELESDKVRKATDADFWLKASAGLFGATTPETLRNRARNKATLEEFNKAIALGYGTLMGLSEDEAKTLQTQLAASGGGGKAGSEARAALTRLSADQRRATERAIKDSKSILTAELPVPEIMSAEQAEALFSTGRIPVDRYLKVLEEAYTTALSVQDPANPESVQATVSALQKWQSVIQGKLQARLQVVTMLNEIGGAVPEQLLPSLKALLFEADKPNVPAETGYGFAVQMVQAQRQAWLKRIEQATTGEEAAAIAATPPTLDPRAEELIRRYAGANADFILSQLEIKLTPEEIQAYQVRSFDERLAALDTEAARTQDPQALAQIARRRIEVNRERARSERKRRVWYEPTAYDRKRGLTEGYWVDEQLPLTREQEESFARDEAESARVEAQNAFDVSDARRKLNRARQGRNKNQLVQARRQKEDAQAALQRARELKLGLAAELNAQADIFEADRAIADAMFEIGQSRLGLLSAIASAAGRDADAARLMTQQVQAELNRQLATDPTDELSINQLRTRLTQSREQEYSTWVQERREIIDFQREMGEITVGQAIAQLQALLASPQVQANQDRIREIKLAIRALQKETQGELQFNIGDLRLPTYYEVKRMEGARAGGFGYSDRRIVNINMNNYNATDYQGAIDQMVDLWNSPSRYGTTPSLYPGR